MGSMNSSLKDPHLVGLAFQARKHEFRDGSRFIDEAAGLRPFWAAHHSMVLFWSEPQDQVGCNERIG
jgi:hypothetical protein